MGGGKDLKQQCQFEGKNKALKWKTDTVINFTEDFKYHFGFYYQGATDTTECMRLSSRQ